jgi:hypothetical protein
MEAKNLKRFSDLTDVDIYQSSSIQEIKTKFEEIKKKLEPIKNLEINDKLACDCSGNYYIDKNDWLQLLSRKYFNQSRGKTSKDLNRDFQTLMNIFDVYLEYIKMPEKEVLILLTDQKELTKEMVVFIIKMVKGLYNLKQTYPKNEDIVCRIDSIILTLCECKERLEATNIPNVSSFRIRAFSQ